MFNQTFQIVIPVDAMSRRELNSLRCECFLLPQSFIQNGVVLVEELYHARSKLMNMTNTRTIVNHRIFIVQVTDYLQMTTAYC